MGGFGGGMGGRGGMGHGGGMGRGGGMGGGDTKPPEPLKAWAALQLSSH
jgi:hypothetical protein